MESEQPRLLSVAEAADLLGVTRLTVYRLVHAGELPALRFGPVYRIPEKSLRVVQEILPRSA
ncbi:MAG: hypothetical protein JWP66_655 [Naasia sp.]|nr:hypothetical protein [Naasia sp.]